MTTLLIIGYVWPEPASSAAGARMMQLIEFFKSESYQITFATTAKPTQNKTDLRARGIHEVKIKLNDSEFDVFLEDLNPDIVLFDRFMMEEQFGWRVDNVCPDAIKILDTEDLHFLRNARYQAYKSGKEVEEFYLDSDLTIREISAIYRCDLSLIISDIEMELLTSKFGLPKELLLYMPFMLDPLEEGTSILPAYEERKDFISIGNFLHEPNWNAVLYLKEKVWPLLRKKLPEARLNIYGAYPSQKVFNLDNPKENFFVHGWVEDSQAVMRKARVCLAPIQFGAGLKGKLIEAMTSGTPSVTTRTGAEGINNSDEWNGFITGDLTEFVNYAVQVYNDKDVWNSSQKTGIYIINNRFNKEQHHQRFNMVLNQLKTKLSAHRDRNFTGKMLKHHLHKSTYYMSRFIEEKNKLKN